MGIPGRHMFIRDERVQTRLYWLMAGFAAFVLVMVPIFMLFPTHHSDGEKPSSVAGEPNHAGGSETGEAVAAVLIGLVALGGMAGFTFGMVWVIKQNAESWKKTNAQPPSISSLNLPPRPEQMPPPERRLTPPQ